MNNSLVIVPTYNEAENIVNIINHILSLSVQFDILIVDDNSPDGTGDKIKLFQKKTKNHAVDLAQIKVRIIFL